MSSQLVMKCVLASDPECQPAASSSNDSCCFVMSTSLIVLMQYKTGCCTSTREASLSRQISSDWRVSALQYFEPNCKQGCCISTHSLCLFLFHLFDCMKRRCAVNQQFTTKWLTLLTNSYHSHDSSGRKRALILFFFCRFLETRLEFELKLDAKSAYFLARCSDFLQPAETPGNKTTTCQHISYPEPAAGPYSALYVIQSILNFCSLIPHSSISASLFVSASVGVDQNNSTALTYLEKATIIHHPEPQLSFEHAHFMVLSVVPRLKESSFLLCLCLADSQYYSQ